MTFDIEKMQRELDEDDRRWRERKREWEMHDMQVRLAIQHAALMYGLAMGQMWAAALRTEFQEGESR